MASILQHFEASKKRFCILNYIFPGKNYLNDISFNNGTNTVYRPFIVACCKVTPSNSNACFFLKIFNYAGRIYVLELVGRTTTSKNQGAPPAVVFMTSVSQEEL